MTTRRKLALTPVNITERARSFRTGRLEMWAAESRDGRWFYKREESTGTPWIAEDRETGELHWFGTLRAARYATANWRWGHDLAVCPDCQIRGGHDDKCPALV